jgi:hypothetical protein
MVWCVRQKLQKQAKNAEQYAQMVKNLAQNTLIVFTFICSERVNKGLKLRITKTDWPHNTDDCLRQVTVRTDLIVRDKH